MIRGKPIRLAESSKSFILRAQKKLNCEILNIGIGEKNFTSKINIFPETNTGASSIIKKYNFFNKTQEIKIQTLDDFVLNKGIQKQIDLIKIDVEGYELKVIEGMKNLLANKKINSNT